MDLLKICLIVLGTTIIQTIGWLYFPPLTYLDFPLVITIYFALSGRRVNSALVGAVLGLTQDAVQGLPLGIHGFAMTLAGYSVAAFSKKLVVERQGAQWLVIFMASLGSSLIVLLLLGLIDRSLSARYTVQAIAQSIVTSIFGVFIIRFLRRSSALTRRFKPNAPKYGAPEKF